MEKPSGTYRHFKGGIYRVICIARDSETGEELVVYENVEEPEKIWARPLSMFCETVQKDGVSRPRFEKI